jgi:hypothetical protein
VRRNTAGRSRRRKATPIVPCAEPLAAASHWPAVSSRHRRRVLASLSPPRAGSTALVGSLLIPNALEGRGIGVVTRFAKTVP